MQFKAKRKLGLFLLVPAVLFLFEPILAFTDALPNCIGYLLLCAAISQVADLNDRIADALERFKKMIWVGVGSLLVQMYINRVLPSGSESMNAYERPMLLLIASFVLLLLHCYFLIPAYRDLFLGMNAVAERFGGSNVLKADRRGTNHGEKMARAAKRFAFWNALLALLPELSVLTTFEFAVEKLPFDWYVFIGLFRTIVGMISAVVSLVFLIRFLRYANRLLKDKPLMENLEARYTEAVLPNTYVLGMRRYRFAFALMMVGAAFTVRIRMDERDLLPTVIGACLLAVGILWMGEHFRGRRAALAACLTLAVISLLQRWRTSAYLDLYLDAQASMYTSEAFRAYLGVRMLTTLEILCTLFAFGMIFRLLYELVRARLHVMYGGADAREVSQHATERLHKRMRLRMCLTAGVLVLSAAASLVEVILGVLYPWLWWITLAVSLAAVIAFMSLLFTLLDELDDRLSTEWLYKQEKNAHTDSVTPKTKKECSNHAEQSEQKSESAEQSEQESAAEQSAAE
ncbi:MAG: hypothetical protein IJW29_00860 [Clostridia bacterium]|nr:hypothetical protein [Clostridia bacterium]